MKTQKLDNWMMRDDHGKMVKATTKNIMSLLSNPYQKPHSEEENRATEKRYLTQLNTVVKCYHDGHNNVIEFI